MKKTLLALTIITFSATLFAAEPPPTKPENVSPIPMHQKPNMSHEKDRPCIQKKEQHLNTLLDVTIKSDNPTETIKNITTLIPENKAKQYNVHVSITELPNIDKTLPTPEDLKPSK